MTNQVSEEKRRKSLTNLPINFEVREEEIYPSEKLSPRKHIKSAIEQLTAWMLKTSSKNNLMKVNHTLRVKERDVSELNISPALN